MCMRCACVVPSRFPALAARRRSCRLPLPSRRGQRVRRRPPFRPGTRRMLGSFRNRRAGVLIWALMVALVRRPRRLRHRRRPRHQQHRTSPRSAAARSTADDYVRAMQQELRALTQQLGRDLPITEARQYGVDRMVLARLVNDAALDNEAARLGVSDRRRHGLEPGDGDPGLPRRRRQVRPRDLHRRARPRRPPPDRVRGAAPRARRRANLLAGGVQAAATMPDTAALTVLAFLGEQARLRLDPPRRQPCCRPRSPRRPTPSSRPSTTPTADRYTRPETREISYASITPEALAADDRDPRRRPPRRLRRQRRHLPDPRAPRARPHRLPDHRGGRRRQGPPRRRRDRLRRARHRARPEARGHRPGHRRRRHASGRGARRGLRRRRRPRHRRPGRRPRSAPRSTGSTRSWPRRPRRSRRPRPTSPRAAQLDAAKKQITEDTAAHRGSHRRRRHRSRRSPPRR